MKLASSFCRAVRVFVTVVEISSPFLSVLLLSWLRLVRISRLLGLVRSLDPCSSGLWPVRGRFRKRPEGPRDGLFGPRDAFMGACPNVFWPELLFLSGITILISSGGGILTKVALRKAQ